MEVKHCHYFCCIALLAMMLLSACDNNLEVVKNLESLEKMPDVSQTDIEIIYSDSAKVRAKITAKRSDIYAEQYFEFPLGMRVFFYDDSLHVTNQLTAKYAIYHIKKDLYEARNDVVVINSKGQKLNTEQLFWDRNKHIIYSQKYCKVTDADGLPHVGNNGLESDEKFEEYHFKSVRGTLNIPVEESEN